MLLFCVVFYFFSLPNKIFISPSATVVTSDSKELLGAVIAKDGQWRFPELDSVPNKFKHCVLQFEDAYFYKHFGFNPVSIIKAIIQNINSGKVVRGGSTISQQVIRLYRNKRRTYYEKLIELVLATRLEFKYSKENILKLYASHAPFGGNVVGLEMASWRYFGLQPHQLSWAESATLAVLPNAPSLIFPGKNQEKLKIKRDRLLHKLYKQSIIDSTTYALAVDEQLPQKPYKLPQIAPHLVQEIAKTYQGKKLQTSIDIHLQKQINYLVNQHYKAQKQNEVYNMSVLVLDVNTRKVLAYVGNSSTDKVHQKDVNNIISKRSTGSVLKPFLYAHALYSGQLLPNQLVADVPTEIGGYTPKNFDLSYQGAVPANIALTKSLNIPAVRLLKTYGLQKFKDNLSNYGLTNINNSADYYGLSLILGGAEESLWNLCKVYAGYASTVNHYEKLGHKYYQNEFINPIIVQKDTVNFGKIVNQEPVLDVGSIYTTLQTLTEVNRPEGEQSWKYYSSSQKVAWKTGTSFGNKDAWAIGVTPKYVVGVWVGNSDGEGRASLTGAKSASPLLFNVFGVLPKTKWFLEPYEDLIEEQICIQSGYLALPICNSSLQRIPKNSIRSIPCPYHHKIQLDFTEQYRVNANCEDISKLKTKTWFSLPPLLEHYYKQNNSDYRAMPSFRTDCNKIQKNMMDFVFPTQFKTEISLTKSNKGTYNPVVIKLAHIKNDAKVFWYINNNFKTETEDFHELSIVLKRGVYVITAIDNYGNQKKRIITIKN